MKNFTTNQHEPTRTATRYEQKVRDIRVVCGKIILIRGVNL